MFNTEDMPPKTSIAGPSSKTKAFQPGQSAVPTEGQEVMVSLGYTSLVGAFTIIQKVAKEHQYKAENEYVAARHHDNEDGYQAILIRWDSKWRYYRQFAGRILGVSAEKIRKVLLKRLKKNMCVRVYEKQKETGKQHKIHSIKKKRELKDWVFAFDIKGNARYATPDSKKDYILVFGQEAGCCPPDASCRVMSQATTEEHIGFDHVDQNSAGMCMPMQPLTGYGGRPMKNLCWVPVVAAISGTDCDKVLTTVYGCTHTSEDCPDERMDPLELLENCYNIPCHDVFTVEDIHKVHQCKEYVADDLWKAMKTAVHASKPILLLAASRSYRGYVHCLMVVGIHENDTQILVTDACERGVFRSEFKPTCPKQIHCTNEEARGSLSLNVYINNKVCEQYRVICVAVF
jgi:hypothetical protein